MYPIQQCRQRQAGQGLGSKAVAPRRWASVAWHTKVQDAAKPSMPRSEVNRTPKEIAPFRPISDGRTPESRAPAQPAASDHAPPGRQARSAWQTAPQANRATSATTK